MADFGLTPDCDNGGLIQWFDGSLVGCRSYWVANLTDCGNGGLMQWFDGSLVGCRPDWLVGGFRLKLFVNMHGWATQVNGF